LGAPLSEKKGAQEKRGHKKEKGEGAGDYKRRKKVEGRTGEGLA